MEYLWAWGTLIHEKNLSSKISCQTPLKLGTIIWVAVMKWASFTVSGYAKLS